MHDDEDIKNHIRTLLQSQKLAVLSTHSGEMPHASLVAFASTDDISTIIFATNRQTRKYTNLSADPHVALLIDSRTNKPSDFQKAHAVTAQGIANEVAKIEHEKMIYLYLAKHPELEEFVNNQTCALICVKVNTYYFVNRFQNLCELHLQK
jgi:nitroimidazol reductase NimA-like FMN-containing flavoprotein (pyridoxamine 5'-phosphate oxidase superfamily)